MHGRGRNDSSPESGSSRDSDSPSKGGVTPDAEEKRLSSPSSNSKSDLKRVRSFSSPPLDGSPKKNHSSRFSFRRLQLPEDSIYVGKITALNEQIAQQGYVIEELRQELGKQNVELAKVKAELKVEVEADYAGKIAALNEQIAQQGHVIEERLRQELGKQNAELVARVKAEIESEFARIKNALESQSKNIAIPTLPESLKKTKTQPISSEYYCYLPITALVSDIEQKECDLEFFKKCLSNQKSRGMYGRKFISEQPEIAFSKACFEARSYLNQSEKAKRKWRKREKGAPVFGVAKCRVREPLSEKESNNLLPIIGENDQTILEIVWWQPIKSDTPNSIEYDVFYNFLDGSNQLPQGEELKPLVGYNTLHQASSHAQHSTLDQEHSLPVDSVPENNHSLLEEAGSAGHAQHSTLDQEHSLPVDSVPENKHSLLEEAGLAGVAGGIIGGSTALSYSLITNAAVAAPATIFGVKAAIFIAASTIVGAAFFLLIAAATIYCFRRNYLGFFSSNRDVNNRGQNQTETPSYIPNAKLSSLT